MLVVLLAACGVRPSDGASTAVGDDVPYDLLDVAEPTTTTLPELASAYADIWLVALERVVPVARQVVAPSSVERALGALVAGPTPAEARLGLRSAVPVDGVAEAAISVGVATIDLRSSFTESTPKEQLLALAQLVLTTTEIAEVEVVTFTLEGQSIDVPRGDGSISDGPVTRRDYASLVAENVTVQF